MPRAQWSRGSATTRCWVSCSATTNPTRPGGNGRSSSTQALPQCLTPSPRSCSLPARSPASAGSKLGRVVGEIPGVEQVRPSKKQLARGTAGQLLSAHLTEQTARLHEHDAGVRAGHPESVHRLRIAARRLRSALSTFRPILDRDPHRSRAGGAALARGRSLAPARDAHVLREHLLALVSSEPDELVIGSAVTRIEDQLRADHQTGLVGAREALDSDRYWHLLDTLDTLVASPPLRPHADTSARTMMPRLLARDLKRLRRAVRAIEGRRRTPPTATWRSTRPGRRPSACATPPRSQYPRWASGLVHSRSPPNRRRRCSARTRTRSTRAAVCASWECRRIWRGQQLLLWSAPRSGAGSGRTCRGRVRDGLDQVQPQADPALDRLARTAATPLGVATLSVRDSPTQRLPRAATTLVGSRPGALGIGCLCEQKSSSWARSSTTTSGRMPSAPSAPATCPSSRWKCMTVKSSSESLRCSRLAVLRSPTPNCSLESAAHSRSTGFVTCSTGCGVPRPR